MTYQQRLLEIRQKIRSEYYPSKLEVSVNAFKKYYGSTKIALVRVEKGYPFPTQKITDDNVFNLFCTIWNRYYPNTPIVANKSPKSGTRYVQLNGGKVVRVSNHYCNSLGNNVVFNAVGIEGIKSFFNQQSC